MARQRHDGTTLPLVNADGSGGHKLVAEVDLATGSAVQDAGPAWTTVFGVAGARFTSADASGADAAVTDAPTSGQKLVVTDVVISVDTAMRVDLKCETTGTVYASLYLAANSTVQLTPRGKGWKLATADKKLVVRTSAAGNFHLQAGSPCRASGVDVSLTTDYDGVSVPQGAAPSRGAFEYVG